MVHVRVDLMVQSGIWSLFLPSYVTIKKPLPSHFFTTLFLGLGNVHGLFSIHQISSPVNLFKAALLRHGEIWCLV